MMAPPLHWLCWTLLVAALAAAATLDVHQRRVPNQLVVALAGCGIAARLLCAGPVAGLWGVVGVAAGVALLAYPFARGWLGGGDVKLFAAAAGWLGPAIAVDALLRAGLAGGALALLYLARSPRALRREIAANLVLAAASRQQPTIAAAERPAKHNPPYAVAIAAGTLWSLGLRAAELIAR